jgi:hypothetical protein
VAARGGPERSLQSILHLSYEGYERLGELIAERIIEMGWL